jgi:hypothetical protein
MANFLSRENPDGRSRDFWPVTTPGAPPYHAGNADPAYRVNAHWDDLRSRRSIRRMKILTAISMTVTLALAAQRYAPHLLNHNRQEQTSGASPAMTRPERFPSVSSSQEAPPLQGTGALKAEELLTATKEEVMFAIQEPIRDTELAQTSVKAKAGDTAAQYDMGLHFADGNGVPQNYVVAMTWFSKAALGGDSAAQLKLVFGYIKGIGVPQDENQAVMWLKHAANSGNTWAQRALSNLYLTGQNVPRDYVRAYTWAKIASESERHDNDELRTLGSQMSQAQITNAERRISSWNHARQNSKDQQRRAESEP